VSKIFEPQDEYERVLVEMVELHRRKAHDYGTLDDPYNNLRASVDFGIPPWVGCMLRCNDKMQRVKAFIEKGKLLNESLEDNLMDMAVYPILALVLLREGAAQTS
jgi:hypothetical protein